MASFIIMILNTVLFWLISQIFLAIRFLPTFNCQSYMKVPMADYVLFITFTILINIKQVMVVLKPIKYKYRHVRLDVLMV
jgi:hypothetical protein